MMCTKIYRVPGRKTETENTNRGRVYLYHVLIVEAAFEIGIRFTDE